MIWVFVSTAATNDASPEGWQVSTSTQATAIIRELIDAVDALPEPHLWVRVTGDTTAASCRHHPLAPGTIGDPRR